MNTYIIIISKLISLNVYVLIAFMNVLIVATYSVTPVQITTFDNEIYN